MNNINSVYQLIGRIDDFPLFANDGEETLIQTSLIFDQVAPENSKKPYRLCRSKLTPDWGVVGGFLHTARISINISRNQPIGPLW